MKKSLVVGIALFFALCTLAQAETFLTVYGGGSRFGGDFDPDHHVSLNYGVSLTVKGFAGFEVDWGYAKDLGGSGDKDDNMRVFMANLIVGPKEGRIRPYGAAGVGRIAFGSMGDLFKLDNLHNDLALDVGGGALFSSSNGKVGFRGDIRYFRDLAKKQGGPDVATFIFGLPPAEFTVDFWRLTAGLTIGF